MFEVFSLMSGGRTRQLPEGGRRKCGSTITWCLQGQL